MPVDIDTLYQNAALAQLRDSLSETYELAYVLVKGKEWGANIVGGVATITYTDALNPHESLAHELLHVRLQRDGYRRMRYGFSSFAPKGTWFGGLISCLDNELQHHRFFQHYLDMSFDGTKLYAETAKEMRRHFNRSLDQSKGDIRSIVTDYLSLIAPGGSLSGGERGEFVDRFKSIHKGGYKEALIIIENALAAWRAKEDLNAEDTVREIIRAIQSPSHTFIGYGASAEFPLNGFFVDDEFEFDVEK